MVKNRENEGLIKSFGGWKEVGVTTEEFGLVLVGMQPSRSWRIDQENETSENGDKLDKRGVMSLKKFIFSLVRISWDPLRITINFTWYFGKN